jgi:hypothetical protein
VLAALTATVSACSDGDPTGNGSDGPQVQAAEPGFAECAAPSRRLRPDEPCPVTATMDTGDLPSVLVGHGTWYGKNDLWVSLPTSPAVPVNGRYSVKFGTVTLRDGEFTSEYGAPEMHVRRLDGPGTARTGFGGYAMSGGWEKPFRFWPTGIDFFEPGCWLVTSTVSQTTIQFVLRVGDRTAHHPHAG